MSAPRKVLFVGEDEAYLARVRAAVEAAGIPVERTPALPRLADRVHEAAPDVILFDLFSTEADGMELLASLQRDPRVARIPVIVAADPERVSLLQGAAPAVEAVFTKPVDFEALRELLRRLAPPGAARPKILLAEDDTDLADLVNAFLAAQGYAGVLAFSGRHVVELAAKDRPAAVLLDLMLPGVDGFTLVGRLKSDARTRDIPIVVMTAMRLDPAWESAVTARTPQVVAKDASDELLLEKLGRPPAARRPRILLADDEVDLLHLVKEGLETEGFEVECAEDGQEALGKLRARPPDLAVLDLRMPRLAGLEVCKELRRVPALAGLPVILLSAFQDRKTAAEAATLGPVDFVSKPVVLADLVARIRGALKAAKA